MGADQTDASDQDLTVPSFAGGTDPGKTVYDSPGPLQLRRRFAEGDLILSRYRVTGELGQGGMGIVYRCHDVWDRYPEQGIRGSWQRGLALGGEVAVDAYPYYVTRVDPMPLGALARHILDRVKPLGQNGVLVTGDLQQQVSRVATGTGAITKPLEMRELGADVGILSDDYTTHVRIGAHMRELGFPTILVNHGVAEEWGVQNLAAYLARTFPDL